MLRDLPFRTIAAVARHGLELQVYCPSCYVAGDDPAPGWATEAADPNAWAPYGGGNDLATARVWHRRGLNSTYARG